MGLMGSETTFRYIMDIYHGCIKREKMYFIIVFRQRFYSVYMLILNT